MRLFPLALATIATMMIAGLAAAQSEEQPTEPTEEPAEETAPAEEAEADPQQPQITTEEFGDWQLRCEVESNNCFMAQLASDQQGNPVLEINIVALPSDADAAAGATIVSPLGSLLSEGVVIQVDEQQAKRYAYSWCTRSGCFARFGFVDADITAMKRGNVARVRIVSVSSPDQPVVLDMSLSGFTAAYDKLISTGAPQQ